MKKNLKLVIGYLFLLIGFLLLISGELPNEPLDISYLIKLKLVALLLIIVGYKILKKLNVV